MTNWSPDTLLRISENKCGSKYGDNAYPCKGETITIQIVISTLITTYLSKVLSEKYVFVI